MLLIPDYGTSTSFPVKSGNTHFDANNFRYFWQILTVNVPSRLPTWVAIVTAIINMRSFAVSDLSVSEVARRLGANPKDISDLFYSRKLRDDLCPIVAGRRLIPENYLDVIRMALKRAGRPVDSESKKGVANG